MTNLTYKIFIKAGLIHPKAHHLREQLSTTKYRPTVGLNITHAGEPHAFLVNKIRLAEFAFVHYIKFVNYSLHLIYASIQVVNFSTFHPHI